MKKKSEKKSKRVLRKFVLAPTYTCSTVESPFFASFLKTGKLGTVGEKNPTLFPKVQAPPYQITASLVNRTVDLIMCESGHHYVNQNDGGQKPRKGHITGVKLGKMQGN